MSIRSSCLFLLLCAVVMVLALPFSHGEEGFRICGQCGYENSVERTVCKHCGAEFPPAVNPKEEKAGSNQPSSSNLAGESVRVADEEMQVGRRFMDTGDYVMALCFYRNAAAVSLLEPGAGQEKSGAERLELIRHCEREGRMVKRKCPNCGGTGKRIMRGTTLAGEVAEQEAYGQSCRSCLGSGQIRCSGTVEEWKFAVGRAQSQYASVQKTRGYVNIGRAWVPAKMESGLSHRQKVTLKSATAAHCSSCAGIGRVDCATCQGQGQVKCPNRKCQNGMIFDKVTTQLSKSVMGASSKCTTCNGRGMLSCETCKGEGSVLCRKCEGSGFPPACRKCGGDGLLECRPCSGTGKDEGVACKPCGGEGVLECSSCHGEGRSP